MSPKSRPVAPEIIPAEAFKDPDLGDAFARLMSTPRTMRQQTLAPDALSLEDLNREFPWLNEEAS